MAAPLEDGKNQRDFARETVFTNEKAGMQQVNKEHVRKVVYEMSKDSPHFQNEQRKQAKVQEKLQKMKAQLAGTQPQLMEHLRIEADAKLVAMEAERDLSRTWLHVDLDAFYASVEERDNPALAKVPLAVGGIGMICTANYEARKFGVRAAMPGFIAKRLCPHLEFVKPDFKKYQAAADAARTVFVEIDPKYTSRGLDEASLDATDYCAAKDRSPAEVAAYIRQAVTERTQLTCSVGIAANTMLAKICSDINKPNGQYELPRTREAVLNFMSTLPVRKIPGIGKVTEQMLAAFGVELVSQIHPHRAAICRVFSEISSSFFLRVSLGLGSTEHPEEPEEGEAGRKGISCERTFAAIEAKADLEAKLRSIAESLAKDVERAEVEGKCVTLKLKDTEFKVRTRSVTLPTFVKSRADLEAAAMRLLHPELPIRIRLMGIRLSSFKDTSVEPSQMRLPCVLRTCGNKAKPAAAGAAGAGAPAREPPGVSVCNDVCDSGSCGANVDRAAQGATASAVCGLDAEKGEDEHALPAGEAGRAAPTGASRCSLEATDDGSFAAQTDRGEQRASCTVSAEPALITCEQTCIQSDEDCSRAVHTAATAVCSFTKAESVGARDARAASCSSTQCARPDAQSDAACAPDPLNGTHASKVVGGSTGADTAHPGGSAGSSAADIVRCADCGEDIPRASYQEHCDWHVALSLSAVINGPGTMSTRVPASCPPVAKQAVKHGTGQKERAPPRARTSQCKKRKASDGVDFKAVAPQAKSPQGLERFFTRRL